MKIINEGHKQKAICPKCDKISQVTFKYRDYLTEHGDSIADVLQGFCDGCGERLLVPPQSTPKLKPYYSNQTRTQEYKVPRVVEDILLNIGYRVKMEKPDVFKAILRFYLEKSLKKREFDIFDIKKIIGSSTVRLSVRIDEPTDDLLNSISSKFGVTKNQFVSLILWDAKDKLLENTSESKAFIHNTKLLRSPELKAR